MDNLVCRPKPADVINLDDEEDDDSTLHLAYLPEFRLQSAPVSLGKRSLTHISEHNDDVEVLEKDRVERKHCEL